MGTAGDIAGQCMRVWAVLALVAGVMPHADTTADDGVPDSRPLEEVVTTATRKSEAEAAQDIPLAVTVLGGEALAERRVTDLEDRYGRASVTIRNGSTCAAL